MLKIRLLFLIFLFYCNTLLAVDVDTSLLQGTEKTYSNLLEQLKNSEEKNDDIALQEALLSKLISISRDKKSFSITVTPPNNKKAYRQLFNQYKEWSLSKAEMQKMLIKLNDKGDVVKSQLRKLNASDDTLSLQLQYVFYDKSKKQAIDKISAYMQAISTAQKYFIEAIKHIKFDLKISESELEKITSTLDKVRVKIKQDDVERERLKLLDKAIAIKKIDTRLDAEKTKQQRLLDEKLEELFIQFSASLQAKQHKAVFAYQKKIMKMLGTAYPNVFQADMRSLFTALETDMLGHVATIKGAAVEEIKGGLSLFWKKANAPLITINDVPVSTLKLILVLLIFIVSFIIGGIYKRYVKKGAFGHSEPDSPTRTLLANLGNYLIIIIAFFIALNIVGINLSSIAIVAGALSVGIGFGLQNIVSNFISGIILMFERSIKIGDHLMFDNSLHGRVTDIRMRSTTIVTNDNIDVIIPNQKLIEDQVINWTMNDQIRRFRIPFGVAYGTDVHKVIEVVLKAVGNSGFTDIYSSRTRQTTVIMTGMGDSSIDFMLSVWIKGKRSLVNKGTISSFLILIYNALAASDIEIPFPQRDLHVRSLDVELPKT